MHLPASFCPFCKCSMGSCLSSLDAISPETNHDSVRGSPRAKTPRLLALSGVSRRDGRLSLSRTEPCLSPPFLSSPSLLRMHVVKTRFHLVVVTVVSNRDWPGLYYPTPYLCAHYRRQTANLQTRIHISNVGSILGCQSRFHAVAVASCVSSANGVPSLPMTARRNGVWDRPNIAVLRLVPHPAPSPALFHAHLGQQQYPPAAQNRLGLPRIPGKQ